LEKSDGTYLRETDHADLTYDRYLKNSEGTTIEIHTRTDSGYTEHDKLVDDEVHHNHVIDIQYDGVNKWLDKKDAYDAVNGDHIVHREFVSDDGANTITSDSVSHLDGSSDYHEVSVTNGIKKTEDLHDADTSLRTYDSVLVFVNPDGSNSRETEHVVNGYLTSHFEQQSASGSFIKDVQLPDISAPDTYDYVSTSTSVDGSDTVQETWHVIKKFGTCIVKSKRLIQIRSRIAITQMDMFTFMEKPFIAGTVKPWSTPRLHMKMAMVIETMLLLSLDKIRSHNIITHSNPAFSLLSHRV
jgi:hypothetical protein